MPKKQKGNPEIPSNSPLQTELVELQSSPSKIVNQKLSYIEYIDNFEKQHYQIDYKKSSSSDIEKSLKQMRVLLRQFNTMINKMMDKNYQFLAEHTSSSQIQVLDVDKELGILNAEIQNCRKLTLIQQAEMESLIAISESINNKQEYEQKLILEISEIKGKIPQISLQSKHNISGINKNGYTLINQEQDDSLYLKVNALNSDLERAQQRLRKLEAKETEMADKLTEFQERQYDISIKLDECISWAKQNSIEVTSKGTLISYKSKFEEAKKRRDQQRKKIALFEHVNKANQQNIHKSITEMNNLIAEYEEKSELLTKKIKKVEKDNDSILNRSNIIGQLTKRSLPYKFAETLLKSQGSILKKQENKKQIQSNKNEDLDEDLMSSGNRIKPYLPIKRQVEKAKRYDANLQKQKREYSKPDIANKNQKKEPQNSEEMTSKSQIFSIRKRPKSRQKIEQQSPSPKLWKNDDIQVPNQSSNNEYKNLKPAFSLRRKSNLNTKRSVNGSQDQISMNQKQAKQGSHERQQEQNAINMPRFSRLNNKRKINKEMTDDYMKYLQDKGRKILELEDKQ